MGNGNRELGGGGWMESGYGVLHNGLLSILISLCHCQVHVV